MLKGRNVHTCINSELYVVIIHRGQGNSWVTAGQHTISNQLCCMSDHFSEIVKYCFGHLSLLYGGQWMGALLKLYGMSYLSITLH